MWNKKFLLIILSLPNFSFGCCCCYYCGTAFGLAHLGKYIFILNKCLLKNFLYKKKNCICMILIHCVNIGVEGKVTSEVAKYSTKWYKVEALWFLPIR